MSTYTVRVTEQLQRKFSVDADSWEEAFAKASDMYRNCEVILDASDFTHATISISDSDEFDL